MFDLLEHKIKNLEKEYNLLEDRKSLLYNNIRNIDSSISKFICDTAINYSEDLMVFLTDKPRISIHNVNGMCQLLYKVEYLELKLSYTLGNNVSDLNFENTNKDFYTYSKGSSYYSEFLIFKNKLNKILNSDNSIKEQVYNNYLPFKENIQSDLDDTCRLINKIKKTLISNRKEYLKARLHIGQKITFKNKIALSKESLDEDGSNSLNGNTILIDTIEINSFIGKTLATTILNDSNNYGLNNYPVNLDYLIELILQYYNTVTIEDTRAFRIKTYLLK